LGTFFSGHIYIALRTAQKKDQSLAFQHEAFLWIGSDALQADYASAGTNGRIC
jgi:hypothetical protein